MAQGSLTALKVYGVAAVDSAQTSSLADSTSLVHYRALAAVVEPSAYSNVTLDEKEMEHYLAILDEVTTHAAVLPAPPGTVFRSHGTLTAWLELHYFTLTEAMNVIEGHSAARVSIRTPATHEAGVAEKSFQALAAESLRALRGQAAATVTLPHADEDEAEGIVARASFLIDSQRWTQFEEAVAVEAKRQSAVDFQVTGPWPPYDFVRMQFGT
ncbi:MAG TPA: GvpL/GvpF family gas vesicle protein [Gemmatimonadaceae bacterium]|nr:GvpL/GvpF family gas vesicle protein [Gemmatimonadaceae bacterium]